MLHLVGCFILMYQGCTVTQISISFFAYSRQLIINIDIPPPIYRKSEWLGATFRSFVTKRPLHTGKKSKHCNLLPKSQVPLHHSLKAMLTYLLTPWYWVLLENVTGLQLVNKFLAIHGTRRFITALTSVRHLSISWASPIQSIYPQPTSWRSILILSTHLRLGLPSGLLPSGFPIKTLYISLSAPIRATCPAHLILLDFITRTILGEE